MLLINSILVARGREFISKIIIRITIPNAFVIATGFLGIGHIIILIANIEGIRSYFEA